ncbi:tripartite motif-containing protein 45-like isoform X2 [Anneissia japonica]|uniref:tripartite motif-containing protein 45-like isoform X2 n=1 Tax=Anneissia japonica TaxID=1529436 RepID=UPI00142582B3|nr:tripartite motif-containing protein 45-like isoform X2 [Anneissia japonica]
MAEGGRSILDEQKTEIKDLLKTSLRSGDTWYLVYSKWFKQWKKYVGYDSWDMYNVGMETAFPGPVDNSPLICYGTLQGKLIDDLDYVLLPTKAWEKLVFWYGIMEGQKPIARKVVEYGTFVKHCKVEVYLMELKLCSNSNPVNCVSKKFSKADTIGTIENVMREVFNIPNKTEITIWCKYMSNTYEQLAKKDNTVQDAGLHQGQVLVVDQKHDDGPWPCRMTISPSSRKSQSSANSHGSSSSRSIQSMCTTASKCVSKEIIAGIEATALQCPLCLDRFTNPKLLPCVHSFCLVCVEKWVKESKGRLSCPTCRKVCKIPKEGLKKLPNNIFIIGLLDYVTALEQKSVPKCACQKAASYFCQECEELYCTECKDSHRIIKTARDHTILSLEEYKSIDPVEKFASKPINCPKHTMPFHFFCDTCKKPVCVGCTQLEHPRSNDHNIIDTKDAFQTISTVASQLVAASDEKLLSLRASIKKLKKSESLLNSNYTKCKTDIRRQRDELCQLIDLRMDDQLQNLESCYKQKLKVNGTQINEVELAIAKLSSMREISHNLVKSPNQVMALMSISDACGRLQEVLDEEVSTKPQESSNMRYYPNSTLLKEPLGELCAHERNASSD